MPNKPTKEQVREQLMGCGVSRVNFSYCWYDDAHRMDFLEFVSQDNLFIQVPEDISQAFRHMIFYHQSNWYHGVYCWLLQEDRIATVGDFLLTRPNEASGSSAMYYFSGNTQKVAEVAAWSSAQPEGELKDLHYSPDVYVRRALAQNPNIPGYLVNYLAGDCDEVTRNAAHRHRFVPTRIKKHIAEDTAMALDPKTPVEFLELLAGSEWAVVRQAVAVHPNLPTQSLERLANDPIWQVRAALLESPIANIDLKDSLMGELLSQRANVRCMMGLDPTTPKQMLLRLMKDPLEEVAMTVAQNCMMPEEAFWWFANCTNDLRVFALILSSVLPEPPKAVLEYLLADPHGGLASHALTTLIRDLPEEAREPYYILEKQIAEAREKAKGSQSPEELALLVQSPWVSVRKAALENKKILHRDIVGLASDVHGEIREAVAWTLHFSRKNMFEEDQLMVAELLCDDPCREVREPIAFHFKNPKALAKLALDEDVSIRYGVVHNKQTGAEALRYLAHDTDPEIRAYALVHPNMPVDFLEELANSSEAELRLTVARNPSTPKPVLRRLQKDQDERVQKAATQNLNSH